MAKDEAYEEPPKGNRRNDKQINRCNLLPMIAKETLPALQWPAPPRHHVDRDRRLRDIDAQFEQLAVDPGSAPQRILNTHPSDQVAHLLANPWPPAARTGFPPPKAMSKPRPPTTTGLPRLPASPFQRAVPTTPADQTGACVDCFPVCAAFPALPSGRRPHHNFRGVLRLLSRYGPLDRSAARS